VRIVVGRFEVLLIECRGRAGDVERSEKSECEMFGSYFGPSGERGGRGGDFLSSLAERIDETE